MEKIDVTKIMNEIRDKTKNIDESLPLNSKNVVLQSSNSFKERVNKSPNSDSTIEKIKLLDKLVDEKNSSTSQIQNSESFDENLIQANTSYDVQTVNKIETSKPKILRNLVLKFRNIIQNEIRFALNPIVDNQVKFNIHIVKSVNGLKKIVDKIELSQIKRTDKINSTINKRIDEIELTQRKHMDKIERIADIDQRKRMDVLSLFGAYNMYLKRDPTESEMKQWLSDDYENDPSYQLFSTIKSSNESKNMLELTENFDSLITKKTNDLSEIKEILKQEKNSDPKHAISFVNFQKILQTNTNPFSERHTEYLWVLKNLPTKGTLLDVGSLDSELANELSKINKLQVFGIDIRIPEEKQLYNFSNEDCTNLSFQNSYFDYVTVVSSIEHFGLNIYGGKNIDNADKLAMDEIKRVLKPQGLLFLTIPFGKYSKPWSRVYNSNSLNELLLDFEILEEKYFEQTYAGWEETTKAISELNEGAIFRKEEESSGALACILAKLNK